MEDTERHVARNTMPVVTRGDGGFAFGMAGRFDETVTTALNADADPLEQVDEAGIQDVAQAGLAAGGLQPDQPVEAVGEALGQTYNKLNAIAFTKTIPESEVAIETSAMLQGAPRRVGGAGASMDVVALPGARGRQTAPVPARVAEPGLPPAASTIAEHAVQGVVPERPATPAPTVGREMVTVAGVREVEVPRRGVDGAEVRRVVVRLEPQHFGKVSVVMVRRGEDFSMRVMPEHTAAADVLKNDGAVLSRLLRAAGVGGETVSVQIVLPERAGEGLQPVLPGTANQHAGGGQTPWGSHNLAAGHDRRPADQGFAGTDGQRGQGGGDASYDDEGAGNDQRRADHAVYL